MSIDCHINIQPNRECKTWVGNLQHSASERIHSPIEGHCRKSPWLPWSADWKDVEHCRTAKDCPQFVRTQPSNVWLGLSKPSLGTGIWQVAASYSGHIVKEHVFCDVDAHSLLPLRPNASASQFSKHGSKMTIELQRFSRALSCSNLAKIFIRIEACMDQTPPECRLYIYLYIIWYIILHHTIY